MSIRFCRFVFRQQRFQTVDNPALRNKYIYNNILFIILFNGGHMWPRSCRYFGDFGIITDRYVRFIIFDTIYPQSTGK